MKAPTLRLARRVTAAVNGRTLATTTVVAVLATVVTVAAVRSDGARATNVQLDDGAVWVTNGDQQRVGRLNVRIDELDLAVQAAPTPEVLQDGRTVLFTSAGKGMKRIEPATGVPSGSDNTIEAGQYRIGGGVGTVFDTATGRLWVGRADTIVAPEYPKKADLRLPEGSHVVVTRTVADRVDARGDERGMVLVADPEGWYELELGPDLEPVRPGATADASAAGATSTTAAPDSTASADPEPDAVVEPVRKPLPFALDDTDTLTAVGGRMVLLKNDGTVAAVGGKPAKVPGASPVLQQVGPAGSTVLVASSEGLFEVGLGDGSIAKLSAKVAGSPAAPVRVGACVFGAWAGTESSWFKACSGRVVSDGEAVPRARSGSALVWRVNRNNVALNSPGDGGVWAEHDGKLAFVGNWTDVGAAPDQQEDKANGTQKRVSERQCVIGGSDAPVAGDDQLGARPRQSIIDLLYNDDDVNCEPIAIASVEPAEGPWGQLTIIDNGQHLLYSPSEATANAARSSIQSFSFSYQVVDPGGRTSAAAKVSMTVRDTGLGNAAPALRPKKDGLTRTMRTVVEEGRAVNYNVLADWWDPDGDELRVDGAVPQGPGEATSTPDGAVRYAANGVGPGVNQVSVTVSDGVLATTENLEVTVKPAGSAIPPVTADDFITLVEGAEGRVLPLANDSDPNENTLALRPVWTQAAATGYRTQVVNESTVVITAVTAGTYALSYEASDGIDATRGTILLKVVKPDGTNHAPVAVPDQVKLRVDRVVNVDVLANDVDADGDLLAVTDVTAPPAAAGTPGVVRASVVDRRLVQIEVTPGADGVAPKGPFFVTYTIEDGFGGERATKASEAEKVAAGLRATGTITVLVQPATADQAPLVSSDSAVVRTGDIVAVPVLVNDTDPDGDPLVLKGVDAAQAAALEAAGDGVAWTQGRLLYVQGGKPGRKRIQYSVTANGREATGELSVEVKPLPDPATNPDQAPSPTNLVLRAVRDATVRLPVPLFGADADGDSVTLLDRFDGLQGAAQGNRVAMDPDTPNTIAFTAGATAGATDSFSYTVRDPFGRTGTATVRVMILENKGWAPQAHDDVLRGKAGRILTIPVLANDTSPQDARLELAELPFFDVTGQPSASPQQADAVKVLDQTDPKNRGRLEVVVPPAGTTLSEHYRISDGQRPGDAFVRVTADENTPNLPPVATVDVVKQDEVKGRDSAEVRVLDNDFDPDDTGAALAVTLPVTTSATVDGGVVTVPLKATAQTVLYRVTDGDGGSSIGIIRVPGRENHAPVLSAEGRNAELRTIEAGEVAPLTISVADVTEDPDGDPDVALTATEISVLGGVGRVARTPDGTGFVYTAPDNLAESARVGITFEVTDRPTATEAERQLPTCNCLASLTVEVVIRASSPPRVVSQGAVQVPQLDEPVTYDLAPLVVDDQGDRLTYTIDASSFGGLDVSLSGSQVTLVSKKGGDARIPVGTRIPLRFTVSDGKFEAVEGVVNVVMIATNKGRPAAGSFPDQQAERDSTFALPNVVSAATNPFPDRPLTLTASAVDGGASVTCTPDGTCQFRSTTVGSFRVTYTLTDAVGQAANGTVTVVVKGKPRAPGVPTIVSVGDHVVTLAWTAADMQGGTFKTYHVTAIEAGRTMDFTATGGQFTGLTNGTSYRFTVTAENELGIGEASAPSSAGIPDRVPDPPVSPAFTDYGDGTLMLAWAPPPTAADFTTIQKYEVQIGGQTLSTDGATTSLTVSTGLQNGTDYTFKVRAQNKATTNNGWGDWSTLSASERPSRYPDAPTGVVATNAGDGGTPRLTVRWTAPAFDGGRAINQYRVCRVQDAANCQTITGLQATFDLVRNQASTFTVVAYNSDKHKNDSPPSAASASVTAVGNPDAPTITGVTSGDHTLTVNATSANNSGCSTYSIEYSLNGGGTWQAGATFAGLTNGQSYTAVARTKLPATCGTSGVTYASGNSNAVAQTPYGPLRQPTMNSSINGTTITWTWATNRADDGRPDWNASLSGPCSAVPVGNGSHSQNFGYGPTAYSCTLTISAGGQAPLAAASGQTTPAPPPRFINTSNSGTVASPKPTCASGCTYVSVSGGNFTPNAALEVNCEGDSRWFSLTTSRGDGSFGPVTSTCFHAGGAVNSQVITVRDGSGQAAQVSQW